MATYVLIPGAWLGGWCWKRVAPLLRAAGHDVYPLTLTGLGERVHLGTPMTGLETHVEDVLNVLRYEDLSELVLVGHSYAGLVAGSVASRTPERIAHLVYLAANLPAEGTSLFDGWSAAGRASVEAEARDAGTPGWWPLPDDLGGLAAGLRDADIAWLRARATPHPLRTFADPVKIDPGRLDSIPRTFIHCTDDGSRLPAEVADPPAGQTRRLRELPTGHWPMLSTPRELADLLLETA